jgi:hypothetical protein
MPRLDDQGNRLYTWTGRGAVEEFYSVTTILGRGIPKYLVPWAAKLVAELAYMDVERHGKRALRRWAKDGLEEVISARANGAKLESVDVTDKRDLALRHLKGEPERVRDAAAERGSRIHAESEDLILKQAAADAARIYMKGKPMPEWPADIEGPMTSFVHFLDTYRPRYLATEATVFHRGQAYAGTADAFLEVLIDGHWTPLCVDYKSGNRIYPEVAVQCAAYARGEFLGGPDGVTEYPVPTVEGTAVLHLRPKGFTFRRLRYDDDVFRTFLYAREVFRWAIDISKTALGDPIAQDLEDALQMSLEEAV